MRGMILKKTVKNYGMVAFENCSLWEKRDGMIRRMV